jgi:hypothetical protein
MEHRYDGEDREGDRDIEVTGPAKSDHAGKLEQKESLPAAPTDFADSRFHDAHITCARSFQQVPKVITAINVYMFGEQFTWPNQPRRQ